jgi:AraC-like DNA-binding protein
VTRGEKDKTALKREELLLMLLSPVLQKRVEHASIPSAIFEAKSLIDDDPARSITLADLAQVSGLSRFQVLRGFVRSTGLTPHAYLVQRRVYVARRLIAAGTHLAETAVASGFSDQSHMTRTFVRRYGISPGAYADAMT